MLIMSTLEKALDIIELMLYNEKEISLVDIAKSINLSNSTTYRILSVLVKRGYVYQRQRGSKYSLGYKFVLFNQKTDIEHNFINIKSEATPFLKELSEKTSETVVISIFDGREPVDIMVIIPDVILKASTEIGTKSPLHCTAVGKMFLSCMSYDKRIKLLESNKLTPYTENTINDIDRLMAELDNIKKEGVAYDDEEYIMGLRSAAAPIMTENGEVLACIYFFGPSARVTRKKMLQFGALVKYYAQEIGKKIIEPKKI